MGCLNYGLEVEWSWWKHALRQRLRCGSLLSPNELKPCYLQWKEAAFSASGYSKGLAHLLVGRNDKERPMGVSPWSRYQLVDHRATTGPGRKLSKKRGFRRCTSFVCFGFLSTTNVGPPPHPKVGPASDSEKGDDLLTDNGNDENGRIVRLKSSLRSHNVCCVVAGSEMKKVQWTDACGRELAEMREFESSDMGASDEQFEAKGNQSCGCVIQ